jgi:hypothetical protein
VRNFEFIIENSLTAPKPFSVEVKELVAGQQKLPDGHPLKQFSQELLTTIAQFTKKLENLKTEAAVSSSDLEYIKNLSPVVIDAFIREVEKNDPELANKLKVMTHLSNLKVKVANDPTVKKAEVSAVKGIQLNTKAEIGKLDQDIEMMAQKFVDAFGVKPMWARNIIGMFNMSIDRKDRQAFLQACLEGKALDINKMLKMGEGPIENAVTTRIPKVKEVFESVKDTLLDISLSTGQRGATGPFEALLAIMGGARKPGPGEGGDIKLPNGKKFEVKATSLTPSSTLKKDGTLPATGKGTTAWLDSTAGGEISGAVLRQKGTEWLDSKKLRSPKVREAWNSADFRKNGLVSFNTVLDIINKNDSNNGKNLIYYMMSEMFPSIVNLKGYNFKKEVAEIEKAIRNQEPRDIAKIQGIMALLEYHKGKGNDGFIFFNSSTQEYKIFEGIDGIMKLAQDSGNIHFQYPMTMGKSQKASPGLYYGPDPTSQEAKRYFEKFNSDPERVQRFIQAQQNNQRDLESLRGFN